MSERSTITDSPWFWALLFSGFGLILLLLFFPKYRDLQSMRERRYQARERTGDVEFELESMTARRPYSTPGRTLIPVYPLAWLLGVVAVLSAAMLVRQWVRGQFGQWGQIHQIDERWLGHARHDQSDDPPESPP